MFAELHFVLLTLLLLSSISVPQSRGAPAPAGAPARPELAIKAPTLMRQNTERDGYTLDVVFDYEQRRLEVEQQIAYVNRSNAPLRELLLVVEPNRFRGAFDLHALSLGERRTPVTQWTLRGTALAVELPAALPPGGNTNLQLLYTLRLPKRAGTLGYTARQANLGDWYPFVPPLAADGSWLVHKPGAVGEYLVYPQADYVVTLSGPHLESVQIAAPAAAVKTTKGLRFVLDRARTFAWSASPYYQTASRSVNGITVAAYWFDEHALAGQEALNATAQALALYASRFAPYPHKYLASVEAEFADGMEYDGLYFLGQEYYAAYTGEPAGYLSMLSAHETAHQWWYGLVGNDPALDPFLDEAFATYSELIFYEHYYPHLVDWWWQYRVRRFAPVGCVNSTVYDHAGFRSYVNAVYLRGALMLHDLRQAMGDDQFGAFLREYSTANRAAIAAEASFHRSLSAHFDGDPQDLLQTYCLGDHVAPP